MCIFGNVIDKFSRVFVKLLTKKDIKDNRTRRKYADIRLIKMNRAKGKRIMGYILIVGKRL